MTTEPKDGATETAERYDPATIEPKWQAYWEEKNTFATPDHRTVGDKPKAYILDMFPYPSGSGLHVGHPEGYTASDIVARYKRANGVAVLHPMGWDAFGLPAEQTAIKTGKHPRQTTVENIATFRRQLKMLGFSYDWAREVDTTDPAYVKWTQWIFLKLYERGLAAQSEVAVNWCPELGTVLANEEVIDGLSEVGGHPVERRPLRQWVFKITQYAEQLLAGLDEVDWPNSTRTMQTEWIGRSEGAEVQFGIKGQDARIDVFTTRPDTLFGATFMVLAPEHPLVADITTDAQREAVEAYVTAARNKSDRERQQSKEKTGVFTGGYAINPVNGAEVPVYIADYVLWGYGTGAIMAVPAHDERDFAFAEALGIEIIEVVSPTGTPSDTPLTEAYTKPGIAVNSGKYDGLETAAFKTQVIADLEAAGQGKGRVEYKLRDWNFSRQRYWGEPIPIYFPVDLAEPGTDPRTGAACTIRYDEPIAVDVSELPLQLPELDDYKPGDNPEGVLARALEWRFFERDGQWFARETNTMPQWAGSCWYFLRFVDPTNDDEVFDMDAARFWLPVDLYIGGAEHAVLHLLYSRFWHKVLFDADVVPVPEPFKKLIHQGMILGEVEYTAYKDEAGGWVTVENVKKGEDAGTYVTKDGGAPVSEVSVSVDDVQKDGSRFVLAADTGIAVDARARKMSKSRGNVVNPDDIVQQFGADSLRVYEMFMGPLEATKPWSTSSIGGVKRFLDRVWTAAMKAEDAEAGDDLARLLHQTIKKVGEDIEGLRFNTAISQMMVLTNELYKVDVVPADTVRTLVQLLHPFAPHIAEELWQRLGGTESVQLADWPRFDPKRLEVSEVTVPVQVNGKVRGRLTLPKDADQETAVESAKALDGVSAQIEGKQMRKVIWVPNKILNLIVG